MISPQDVRDEVHDKRGMEAVTALLSALEATVSVTPQCLAKILAVLEGSPLTELAVVKMKKALPKTFSTKKKAAPPSSDPGKSIVWQRRNFSMSLQGVKGDGLARIMAIA